MRTDIKAARIKTAEEKLKNSEIKFKEFFENAPEGIVILDCNTMKFIQYNDKALRLLKYNPDDILQKGPSSISPEFQPCGRPSIEKASELIERALKGERMEFEWLAVNADGETFMTETRLISLNDTLNPKLYASFVDITKRKKDEEKLIEQNRMLSEIADLQSHQVRQPVATILGLISLFNFHDYTDPSNAQLLLKLHAATSNFDEVIKKIVLKTSQIERGKDV